MVALLLHRDTNNQCMTKVGTILLLPQVQNRPKCSHYGDFSACVCVMVDVTGQWSLKNQNTTLFPRYGCRTCLILASDQISLSNRVCSDAAVYPEDSSMPTGKVVTI
jgi:hypothetical protein